MITMATFIKLLAINMVANNLLGLSSILSIKLVLFVFLAWMSLICKGLSEKNAISEPEIKPENNSSIAIAMNPNKTSNENVESVLPIKLSMIQIIGLLPGSSKIFLI